MSFTTLCRRLCVLLVCVGCSNSEPAAPPSTELPPPPPPVVVQDTTPAPPPTPVVEVSTPADEYTPNGVNPWNQATLKPTSSFSLEQPVATPSAQLSQIKASIEGGKLPDPATVAPDALVAAFRYAPPPDMLTLVSAEGVVSPFDPARVLVRVTVATPQGQPDKQVAQGALVTVQWDKAAVKRYRLIGFENHTHASPRVAPATLNAGHQTTAIYELERRDDAPPSALGEVTLSYLPGGVAVEQASPALANAPIPFDPAVSLEFASDDTRFALAVAAFAEVLHASPEAKAWKMSTIEALALSATADNPDRAAFAALVTSTRALLPPEAETPPEPTKPTKKPPRATTEIHPSDKDVIVRVFAQNTQDVKDCYKRVIMKHGNLSGRLELDIVITEAGKVDSAAVKTDDIGNGFGACAAERARRWKFPALHKATRVIKPWSF